MRSIRALLLVGLPMLMMVYACQQPRKTSQSSTAAVLNSSTVSTPTRPAKDSLNLRWLPPANRFSEYAVGEPYRPAQDALNAGDVETAYNSFMSRDQSLDGPREKRFSDVLEVAFQQQSHTTPASNYIERVQTYWLPQLKALPNTVPANEEPCRARMKALQEFDYDVDDGRTLTFTHQQSKIMQAFKRELSKKKRVSC